MLFDEFVVVNDVADVILEYGDEHSDVRFLFMAELIRLPMELMSLAPSSTDLSSARDWKEDGELSIFREEDGEFSSELIEELGTLFA